MLSTRRVIEGKTVKQGLVWGVVWDEISDWALTALLSTVHCDEI